MDTNFFPQIVPRHRYNPTLALVLTTTFLPLEYFSIASTADPLLSPFTWIPTGMNRSVISDREMETDCRGLEVETRAHRVRLTDKSTLD